MSGYTHCACRDCFETTVSNDMASPDLCHDCEDAGCEPDEECQSPHAYGGELEPATRYMVIVGNVGTVYDGDSPDLAWATYEAYCDLSDANHGRVGGETVTHWRDEEITHEHEPPVRS